jgi:hypothetical protein
LIAVIAALAVALFVFRFSTSCIGTGSLVFTVENALLPCPGSTMSSVPVRETRKNAVLSVTASSTTTVHAGDLFAITVDVNPFGTPINAVDADVVYPGTLLRLTAKDESLSPFAIRIESNDETSSTEIIQVQPNPGVQASAPLATLTFIALQSGTATISFASSSAVYANDGFGTDVLSSTQRIAITIAP